MKKVLLFISFIATFSGLSQIQISETDFDLGDLYPEDSRFVDIKLTNKNEGVEWLLSVKKPRDVVYLFDRKRMDPDSSMVLRLQANPTKEGKFKYEVPVFLSDREEAITITIKGDLKELPRNSSAFLQGCPDFGSTPPQPMGYTFELIVQVRDSLTNEPIKNSEVKLFGSGNQPYTAKTDRNGKIKVESLPGPYYITANADQYEHNEKGDYFNFRRNTAVIKLYPQPEKEEEEVPIEEPDLEENEEEVVIVIDEEKEEEEIVENTPEQPESKDENIPELDNIPLNEFSDQYFKPVNIVFVVDISSSMNSKGKITLLKHAMHDLINILRPQDKVTIVAFATEASIIMETSSGSNKDELHKSVEKIDPKGSTSGSAGIKLGYKKAKSAYLEDGNNQVIIVTDGAFNRGDNKYKRIIKRGKKWNDINVSVIGIKNSDFSAELLKEVADLGQGDYFSIQTINDAQQNLIKEIKKKAYRGTLTQK